MSDEEYSDCSCTNTIEEKSLLICQDCGNVVRDTPELRWDTKHVEQKEYNNRRALKKSSDYLAPTKKITESVQHGLKLISRLASLLNISQTISKAASETFKQISQQEVFKHRKISGKQCIAIWCLYLISRKHGYAISLSQIIVSSDIICEIGHLSNIYSLFRIHFSELSSYVDLIDLVPIPLEEYNFDNKEKQKIIQIAKELAELFQKTTLVQGYNPIFVIQALAFFAWKTQDFNRLNLTYRQYCERLKIQHCETTRQNIFFYIKMLKELYKCSPEYIEQPNLDKIIIVKIPDILRTKNIIAFNFNKSHPDHISRKRTRTRINEYVPELFDEDFSDTEIEQYLKSKEEVRAAVKFSSEFSQK